jgi:thymidine kinase
MKVSGFLKLYVGCMFAGKSSEIIAECRRRLIINQKVLGINFAGDSRYSDEDFIVNHNKEKVRCIKVNKLSEISINEIEQNDFIFIDEGQFFPDLVENVLKWVNEYNKSVYVFGLDGDFKRQPFGHILDLVPQCDEIVKLKALCVMCKDGTEGLFTHRITKECDQILIGNDNYISLCRYHYNKSNHN